MFKIFEVSPRLRQIFDWIVIVGSVLICLLILPTRLPGTELLGIRPNWLLIWVVVWSVKRTPLQGAIAGITLGLIQDGMTAVDGIDVLDGIDISIPVDVNTPTEAEDISYPSHIWSLTIVGVLTALIDKKRYIQEDFISIALIVFGGAIISETITAAQYSMQNFRDVALVWTEHQRIALSSAVISSLWAPVIYYPLNRWWEFKKEKEQ
ncbi:rod shape-determining protein MreD [Spirulina sp. 06S082]|uniref:rod shape-determining protein MreD n=1 Tax=Spirulina sp. 06S082 TaxID=3110248 RepID=UPI002B20DEEE|nr:rod shape-determining protein MreD [Spirulina sp. 06S082]MEA5469359.1 rod shape-determining protein MreD [Spirulina sp. 06S082]